MAKEEQRRVLNIRQAYDKVQNFADLLKNEAGGPVPLPLSEYMLLELHRLITQGIGHPHNKPGEYRDNPKGITTKVGDAGHGGVYKAPKCRDDIELLIGRFLEWLNSDPVVALNPLIRAPLAHYYFERIHPFWDGNGRVGRVLEAAILKCAGFQYSPFAMARYYLEHIDEYFLMFNVARKAAEGKEPYPNTAFVRFFLTGMREVLERLHGRVSQVIGLLIFQGYVRDLHDSRKINLRQYTIVSELTKAGGPVSIEKMRREPWYRALYEKLTPKTATRDLKRLLAYDLVTINEKGDVWPAIKGPTR